MLLFVGLILAGFGRMSVVPSQLTNVDFHHISTVR